MPRVAEFLEEVSKVVERIPTASRPERTFKRHTGHTAFRDSPASTDDGFAVSLNGAPTNSGFGIYEQKRSEVSFVIEIGHAPNAKNDARELNLAADVERLTDILESKPDWSQGSGGAVDLVTLENSGTPDRSDPLWWVTPLTFTAWIWGPVWRE
jgi:hypothetical protein